MQIAIRHPKLVNKLLLASTLYKRDGMQTGYFEGFDHATLETMPMALKNAYLAANPDPKGLEAMFNRDVARMKAFKNVSELDIHAIQAPALVINGDADAVRSEHALALSRALPHAQLMILPGGHGEYIGEIAAPNMHRKIPALVTAAIEAFLDE